MKNQMKYIQISAENPENCAIFTSLMDEYIRELNKHSAHPISKELQEKWVASIITMQGPPDRHLELCYEEEDLIGFLYGKIDHPDHKGYIKPGYGYIMEFYVRPPCRRKGHGRAMFDRLERLFRTDGAGMMYLTPDPVTGKQFWETMGFANTGEKSPENQLYIYEKPIIRN